MFNSKNIISQHGAIAYRDINVIHSDNHDKNKFKAKLSYFPPISLNDTQIKRMTVLKNFANLNDITEKHISMFNFANKHTMNTDYLDARFSKVVQDEIANANHIEIFQGSSEDFSNFYQNKNLVSYENDSSMLIATLIDHKNSKKVILYNILSKSRTNNTILLIKAIKSRYSSEKEQKITVRGKIEIILDSNSKELANKINNRITGSNNTLIS